MPTEEDDEPFDARAALASMRAELEQRAATLRSGSAMPAGGISFGKRVGEGTSIAIERFADVAMHDDLMRQIAAIDAALERITDGAYGTCTACGQPVAPERLEYLPSAATCVRCPA